MKILVAPDSFKGSISTEQFIRIFENEIKQKYPFINLLSQGLSDGGEGSLDILENSLHLKRVEIEVFDPLFKKIIAHYLIDKKNSTAYIELAQASGLVLTLENQDIMKSSSYGTGQLIRHAIENQMTKIVLFIGGSATNDAGIGIVEALGYKFYDKNGEKLKSLGENLTKIQKIDNSSSILLKRKVQIIVAADVDNPFYGKNGAAHIYAGQKGANDKQIQELDNGLKNIRKLLLNEFNIDVQKIKGSGAAGGIGGGMIAFCNASIQSGSDYIFKLLDIESKIKLRDIVITGEGKIDNQTLNNKLIFKLSKLAKKYNKKVWAVCGYFDGNEKLKESLLLDEIYNLAETPEDIEDAIVNAETKLKLVISKILEKLVD